MAKKRRRNPSPFLMIFLRDYKNKAKHHLKFRWFYGREFSFFNNYSVLYV